MPIFCYVGTPGSGKSYAAVQNQILPMLIQGRKVVTNIPLHAERIRETISTGEIVEFPLQRVLAEPDAIFEYATPGAVLVVDEAWKLFPTGKADKMPGAFKTLLAEHRHMVDAERNSMVIVLITQDLSQVCAFVRALVEETYHHKKLSALGLNKAFRVDIYSGAVTGQKPPESRKVRTLNGFYSPKVYRLYNSHTMSETEGEGAVEKSGDSRSVIWKRPIFIVAPLFVLGFIIFGLPVLSKHFGKGARQEKRHEAPASVASGARAAPGVVPPPVAFGMAARPPVRVWAIGGYMLYEDVPERDTVIVTSGPWYATLPLRRYCQFYMEGWLECEYDGQKFSNEVRYLPPAPNAAPIVTYPAASLPTTDMGVVLSAGS